MNNMSQSTSNEAKVAQKRDAIYINYYLSIQMIPIIQTFAYSLRVSTLNIPDASFDFVDKNSSYNINNTSLSTFLILFLTYHFKYLTMSKQHFAKNPWHTVSFGKESPIYVNAIIEIQAQSKVKYQLDKDSGLLKLDRVLFSAVHYPHNYGFIPQTYCDDKDPLDILVICSVGLEPLCLVQAKVIGVMEMIDQGQTDDKIIAVARHDKSVSHFNDISELPEHLLSQIQRFFEDYKKMQNKQVKVKEFLGHKEAYKIVEEAIELYKTTYGSQ